MADFTQNVFDSPDWGSSLPPPAVMRTVARQEQPTRAPIPAYRSPVLPMDDAPDFPNLPTRDPNELLKTGLAMRAASEARGKAADEEDRQSELDKMLEALRAVPIPHDAPAQDEYDYAPDTGGYFGKTRGAESGGNDSAVNAVSGAAGRYQFLPSTWEGLAKEAPELGLTAEGIKDPAQQERAMHYFTEKNRRQLSQVLGRNPTGGELYSAHMFGGAGGSHLVANQDAPLESLFPKVVFDQNPFLKSYQTGRQLLADFNRRFA